MSNTVTDFPSAAGPTIVTLIPMTGSDVAFTFNKWTERVWLQCSASTSSLYLAAASSGNAGIILPVGGSSIPWEWFNPNLGGQTVTFNGTNATNVIVIEQLRQMG